MRGFRRGMLLAATGLIFAAGTARAQDADDPTPEPQPSRLPPGAVVQSLDTGPGSELRRNLMALSENPRSLEALIGAGRAAIGLRDGEAASGFFTRAQEIAPDDPRVKAGLGSANLFSGRPEQALILFAEAVQRGMSESEIAGDRGLAYDMVGDPRRAQQDYALALRRHNDPEIERRLALSLAISGQREAAMRVIDGQLRRHDRAAWRTEAFVLALTGDPAGADDTARRLMPLPNAQAMAPFFARLAYLSPAQKAAAVNFGRFPADGRATQVASNVDTRADPGALAMAQSGPRAQPPLAEPLNGRRRVDLGEQPVNSLIRRRPDGEVAPAVQPRREVAQAQPHRFEPTPPPDTDDEDRSDDAQAQEAPPQRAPVARPREAPAFVPGGNFTLDNSHEEARPAPPPAPIYVPRQPAAPGFGSVGQGQSPSVRQFQTIQPGVLPGGRSGMSEVESMVRGLPQENGAQPQAAAPPMSLAERQARDAAAREAEARYRAGGAAVPARGASAAGGRYWVQIAHGAQRGALSLQYRQVHAQAPGLVESRTAWTAADRGTNRLLLGPFDSARAAQDYIDQLSARNIAAIPWESGAGQSLERLQGGGASASGRAHADQEERPAPRASARRNRQAEADADDRPTTHGRAGRDRTASDERSSSHGRSGRDRAASDDRETGHSRSRRDRSASDERGSAHGRSGRDRSDSDERGNSHSRSGHGRSASDERGNAHNRSGRDRADSDDRASSHGRSSSHRGSDDRDRSSSHARAGHGRAASDDESSTSRHRSSQERRQADHDTRTSRGRSSAEQRPAPRGRRSH